jgi:hypothetical protein
MHLPRGDQRRSRPPQPRAEPVTAPRLTLRQTDGGSTDGTSCRHTRRCRRCGLLRGRTGGQVHPLGPDGETYPEFNRLTFIAMRDGTFVRLASAGLSRPDGGYAARRVNSGVATGQGRRMPLHRRADHRPRRRRYRLATRRSRAAPRVAGHQTARPIRQRRQAARCRSNGA